MKYHSVKMLLKQPRIYSTGYYTKVKSIYFKSIYFVFSNKFRWSKIGFFFTLLFTVRGSISRVMTEFCHFPARHCFWSKHAFFRQSFHKPKTCSSKELAPNVLQQSFFLMQFQPLNKMHLLTIHLAVPFSEMTVEWISKPNYS